MCIVRVLSERANRTEPPCVRSHGRSRRAMQAEAGSAFPERRRADRSSTVQDAVGAGFIAPQTSGRSPPAVGAVVTGLM